MPPSVSDRTDGLVSTERLNGRSVGFQRLNLFGAVGLLANNVWHGAWPWAALRAIWLIIGAHALTRLASLGTAVPQKQP